MSKRIAWRNFADTITSFLRNDDTVARVRTVLDRDGRLLDDIDLLQSVNAQADSYTLVLADAFKQVQISKATAVNLTVPPNSSVAFAIGTPIELKRTGAGLMTVVQGAGVTVTASSGSLTDVGLNVAIRLIKTGTDTWDLQNGTPPPGVWSTWTPSPTGFSSISSTVARYMQFGKLCIAFISVRGTSNLGTLTFTAPVTSATTVSAQSFSALIINSGVGDAEGLVNILSNSTSVNVYRDGVGTAFTASGTKGVDVTMIYETA